MAVLHEPGHTYLHPPGGGEFANTEHLDEDEERLVHNAAAKACDGISGSKTRVTRIWARGLRKQRRLRAGDGYA